MANKVMGRPKKFIPTDENFCEVATAKYGGLYLIASHYKVHYDTINKYLKKKPHLAAFIRELKGYETEIELDIAEHNMRKVLLDSSDPERQFKATRYVLEKKGYGRGWGRQEKDHDPILAYQAKIDEAITVKIMELEG